MWIQTKSTKVRQIMTNRIQLARQKGCDAIDPDNIGKANPDISISPLQNSAN
jgi:hypothetical protein